MLLSTAGTAPAGLAGKFRAVGAGGTPETEMLELGKGQRVSRDRAGWRGSERSGAPGREDGERERAAGVVVSGGQ